MSLVDYEASSDEEEDEPVPAPVTVPETQPQPKVSVQHQQRQQSSTVAEETRRRVEAASPAPKLDPPRPQSHSRNERQGSTVNRRREEITEKSVAPTLKLPDASLLMNSLAVPSYLMSVTDHSSRVAAAMAESESRKRDLSGTSSSGYARSKVPRGNLPHSKSIPDTVDGRLLPPQLTGRSNVVTEDLSKLFVNRRANSSSD